MKSIFYFLIFTFLLNCSEKTSENKDEVYELWLAQKAPENITIIKGTYWESAHWSREYEIYIQINSDKFWWNEFKKINDLDTYKTTFTKEIEEKIYLNPPKRMIEKPEWFKPKKSSDIYIKGNSEYYWDLNHGTIFVHEIQL